MPFTHLWERLQRLWERLHQWMRSLLQPRIAFSEVNSATPQNGNEQKPDPHQVIPSRPEDLVESRQSLRPSRYIKVPAIEARNLRLVADYQRRMLDQYGPERIREAFGRDIIPDRAIYVEARTSSSVFYRWRSGQLSDDSDAHRNITAVLNSEKLPRKPPPGTSA
jgi:hypothetical protein